MQENYKWAQNNKEGHNRKNAIELIFFSKSRCKSAIKTQLKVIKTTTKKNNNTHCKGTNNDQRDA